MSDKTVGNSAVPVWYAIRTRQDFRAEERLAQVCDEVFFPKETIKTPDKKMRRKAVIPHVLFIRTTHDKALNLEAQGRHNEPGAIPFWIYRYPNSQEIQEIPETSVDLLKLLTAEDTTRCQIYNPKEFKPNERVRITGGIYEGYEGYVQRVRKNKHVVVKIEGICMIILPFIHPDLLQPLA